MLGQALLSSLAFSPSWLPAGLRAVWRLFRLTSRVLGAPLHHARNRDRTHCALRQITQIFILGSNKDTRRGLYSKAKFYTNGNKTYKLLNRETKIIMWHNSKNQPPSPFSRDFHASMVCKASARLLLFPLLLCCVLKLDYLNHQAIPDNVHPWTSNGK